MVMYSITCPNCLHINRRTEGPFKAYKNNIDYKTLCDECQFSIRPNKDNTKMKGSTMKKALIIKILKLLLVYMVIKFVVNHSFLKDYLKEATKNIVDELKTFLD